MNGIRLGELEASDMLDVLHFFFEEDSIYNSEIHADTQGALRSNLYRELYGKQYNGYVPSKPSRSNNFGGDEDIKPFDPNQGEIKPYFPPTDFSEESSDPFGGILDSPLK